jgi:hypothetical protein
MECCETTNEAVDVFALYSSVELRRGGPRLQPKPSCTQFALRNLSCDDVVSCRSSSDGRTEENEGGERESGSRTGFSHLPLRVARSASTAPPRAGDKGKINDKILILSNTVTFVVT